MRLLDVPFKTLVRRWFQSKKYSFFCPLHDWYTKRVSFGTIQMASQDQIRAEITKQIIEALESGDIPPWRRPWGISPNSGMPTNVVSGRRYSGVNVLLLRMAAMRHGFTAKHWATFDQWSKMGGKVQRRPAGIPAGRWGTSVVFFKIVNRTEVDQSTGEETEDSFPILRTYTVFNIDQVDGAHLNRFRAGIDEGHHAAFNDFEPAENAIVATNADIHFGGNQAFYSPDGDFIQLPPKQSFAQPKEYYATAFHELAHWSESRCKWYGNYAEGELRAEIASAFMLAELGVPQSDDLKNHEAYLASWLKALRNDTRFIFKSASAASKGADYVLSFSRQPAQEVACA